MERLLQSDVTERMRLFDVKLKSRSSSASGIIAMETERLSMASIPTSSTQNSPMAADVSKVDCRV